MTKKKIWAISIIIFILLIISVVIFKYILRDHKQQHSGYDTYTVKAETPIQIEGKAAPQSVKTYQYNSQVGTLIAATVEDGQKVRQGERLISYDTNTSKRQSMANKVNQAQQQVNKDVTQINQTPNDQSLQTKLTEDQSALSEAQQQLAQYDKQVNDSTVASFNGIVNIKNDSDASDGEPILQLISNQPQVKASVSEFDIDKIKEGDNVNIKINSNGKSGTGKIIKIDQLPTSFEDSTNTNTAQASQQGNMESNGEAGGTQTAINPTVNNPSGGKDGAASKYTVIIGNIDLPIRAGFSLEAKIPLKTLKLPKNVLTKDNQVFVLDSEYKVHKRHIKIERNNDQIIVKKGLKAGDKVIKNPQVNLNDGEKIEVSS